MSKITVWQFDDEKLLLETNNAALTQLGGTVHDIYLERQGDSALDIARSKKLIKKHNLPDVVIGDLKLAGSDDGRNELFKLKTCLEDFSSNHLTAWILRTAQPEQTTHLVQANFEWAALYGFDWFISKGSKSGNQEIIEIGRGVKKIRDSLNSMTQTDANWRVSLFCKILEIQIKDFEEVEGFAPPEKKLIETQRGRGRILITWLLHNVIQYPGLLLSKDLGSVKVGLKPGDLDKIKEKDFLKECLYKGAFENLKGKRYWTHKLIAYANKICDKHGLSLYEENGFATSFKKEFGIPLKYQKFIDGARPDQVDYFDSKHPISTAKAVRVKVDNRPGHFEPAWSHKNHYEDKYFRDDVYEADRHLID